MTTCRKSNIRFATAVCMVALATATLAGFGANDASAGPQKELLQLPKGVLQGPKGVQQTIALHLPCETKYDYPPHHVGGLYVTNSTSKTIPYGSKLTTVLKIGDKSYPQTKKMLGDWQPGKKHLALAFNWNPNVRISCTAFVY